jgi:hypothetical protein
VTGAALRKKGQVVQVMCDHKGWAFLWPAVFEGLSPRGRARVRLRCFRPHWGTVDGKPARLVWSKTTGRVELRYVFPLDEDPELLVVRQAELGERSCRVCGRYVVAFRATGARGEEAGWTVPCEARCGWCGSLPEEWDFLVRLEALPPETPLELGCAYRGRERGRCTGTMRFTTGALRQTRGVAGNGPRTFDLDNRFQLQDRCPVCNVWNDESNLIRANRGVLLAAARVAVA